MANDHFTMVTKQMPIVLICKTCIQIVDKGPTTKRGWERNYFEARQDIEKEIVDFFWQLYTGERRVRPKLCGIPFKQLSPWSVEIIEEDYSLVEIQEAVFDIGRDKPLAQMVFLLCSFSSFGTWLKVTYFSFFKNFMLIVVFLGSLVPLLLLWFLKRKESYLFGILGE